MRDTFYGDCCGDPTCGYWTRRRGPRELRRPMAHDPRSQLVDRVSASLAVVAFAFVVVMAGSIALRGIVG